MTSSEKRATYEESKKYLMQDPTISRNFLALNKTDQEWLLNFFSTGKGEIPYDFVTDFDSFNISPEKDFFKEHHSYLNMKDSIISTKDYEDVKKFYTLLKLSNLGELNKLYNFQDTMILCEIFEQRSDLLKRIFKYNLRKSASSFSGCVHRNKSKSCIAPPTDADCVRVFEKL